VQQLESSLALLRNVANNSATQLNKEVNLLKVERDKLQAKVWWW
jgi:hypothetical protein